MRKGDEKWLVGATAVVVLVALLACKGKSQDSSDAAQTAATASVTADPVPSDQPDTSVAVKPVVKPKPASAASAPLPAATVDVVNSFGLGSGGSTCPPGWTNCCPPGWVPSDDGQCSRPCTADSECHAPNTCKHVGTKAFCGTPIAPPPLPAATVDEVSKYGSGTGECPTGWTNCCPPGWFAAGTNRCIRPCKTDADCHGLPGGAVGPQNKCKPKGTQTFCDRP